MNTLDWLLLALVALAAVAAIRHWRKGQLRLFRRLPALYRRLSEKGVLKIVPAGNFPF